MRIDPAQLQRHLDALREEVAELQSHLDVVAEQQREAALQELLAALTPSLRALVRFEAHPGEEEGCRLAEELSLSLEKIGLHRVGRAREQLELWPEQAKLHLELDQDVPDDSALVRAEVLADGWARGEEVIALPLGRIIEVCR